MPMHSLVVRPSASWLPSQALVLRNFQREGCRAEGGPWKDSGRVVYIHISNVYNVYIHINMDRHMCVQCVPNTYILVYYV